MPLHFSTAWRIAVASRSAVIDCVVDACAENRISTTRDSLNSGGGNSEQRKVTPRPAAKAYSTTLCQVFLHLSLVFFQIWSMAESHYKAFQ